MSNDGKAQGPRRVTPVVDKPTTPLAPPPEGLGFCKECIAYVPVTEDAGECRLIPAAPSILRATLIPVEFKNSAMAVEVIQGFKIESETVWWYPRVRVDWWCCQFPKRNYNVHTREYEYK